MNLFFHISSSFAYKFMRYWRSHLNVSLFCCLSSRWKIVLRLFFLVASFWYFRELWQVYNILFNIKMRQIHVVICLLDVNFSFSFSVLYLCLLACLLHYAVYVLIFQAQEIREGKYSCAWCLSVWKEKKSDTKRDRMEGKGFKF